MILNVLLKTLSSHCSNVSSDLELGLPLEDDGRFLGVVGLPLAGVILILETSPFACFIPNCEKGFWGVEVLGELEILI